ncbi:MAG TPA: ATP-binding domain-containing protein [Janthinobacterium sp.]|jgi:hypothetical protein|nr:ATP-binding domain-containing protein [Janthinobacterium sp.]
MAYIHPDGWRQMSATGAAAREIATLTRLDAALAGLPYEIYHGVHWTNAEKGFSAYGEIDFIVLAPNGRLLLIEQKAGFLGETAQGLVRNYEGKPRLVHNQILRSVHALQKRYAGGDEPLSIDYLLYCPDYRIKDARLAGIDPSHIVDASRKEQFTSIVRQLLPLSEATPQLARVKRFLGNTLSLTPEPSAMIGQATQMVTRISGGLATWARRLEFSPYRLHVVGTAGSGKTQLALAEYGAAIEAGLRPLYVCYNRPLADHIQQLVAPGGRVATFHTLCDTLMRAQGGAPDYRSASVWSDMEELLAQAALDDKDRYDVLIVDEGQDFSASWRDILLRMLKPEGRALWLEDPMQNLYGKSVVPLPGWVTLRSHANYRSPRDVVALLAGLGHAEHPVEAASPFLGAQIEMLTYPDQDIEAMRAQTRHAITLCLAGGFTRADIALATFRGREKSALLGLAALGPHTLKSFTGTYDLFGNPVFREGGLLAESVYRFKGQSAPAVIFTEIDFEQLDTLVFRKLFVGMTRARLKLVLVLSERAAAVLRKQAGWGI